MSLLKEVKDHPRLISSCRVPYLIPEDARGEDLLGDVVQWVMTLKEILQSWQVEADERSHPIDPTWTAYKLMSLVYLAEMATSVAIQAESKLAKRSLDEPFVGSQKSL